MNRTTIPWAQNPDGTPGYTWNPVSGCLANCHFCYARKLANGRLKERMLANTDLPSLTGNDKDDKFLLSHFPYLKDYPDPFYPRRWMTRWDQPIKRKKPSGIFVCSMGELFGPWLPPEWTRMVMDIIRATPQHRYYLLTKQPEELMKWSPFPENCYVGVSTTDQHQFNEAMRYLPQIRATVKYLSIEPMLSRILTTPGQLERFVDWVIIGAQSKPTIMPEYGWVAEIVGAAFQVGVPVFLKNSLSKYGPLMRQEMPKDMASE